MTPTATPTAVNGAAADDLTDVARVSRTLNRTVVFTHVSVHRWRGQRTVEDVTVRVGGRDAPAGVVTDPRWKLLTDAWSTRFNKAEGKIRSVIANASPSFPIPGVYVIPRSRARELFAEVDRLKAELFDPLVREFVDGWPAYVETRRAEVNDPTLWEQVAKGLPTQASLRHKFAVVKHVIPMAGSLDGELAGADADDYAAEIQAAAAKFIEDSARTIVASLHGELAAAVDNLVQRLDGRGVVRGGTLDQVRAAFEKLRSFAFAAGPELLARMHAVEEQLAHADHQDLNLDNRHGDRDVTVGLATALRAVLRESDRELSGRRGRAVEF